MSSNKQQLREPFASVEIAAVFRRHPPAVQKRLLALRDLIFASAKATPGVGALEETLKWGQASYLTPQTKSGTTVRLDYIEPDALSPEGACGIYGHCQTNLVAGFRRRRKACSKTDDEDAKQRKTPKDHAHPCPLIFEGTRCIRVPLKGRLPNQELREFFSLALTYHLRKKASR